MLVGTRSVDCSISPTVGLIIWRHRKLELIQGSRRDYGISRYGKLKREKTATLLHRGTARAFVEHENVSAEAKHETIKVLTATRIFLIQNHKIAEKFVLYTRRYNVRKN